VRSYGLGAGRITLDGADVTAMTRNELRSRMGMVLQDTWLFGGTIRDNIAYGRPGAWEDEILEAARATHVDRFVRSLPEGYDTVLEDEGSNVSAGEKQLLTIARAFLARPSVLILDEATSSPQPWGGKLVDSSQGGVSVVTREPAILQEQWQQSRRGGSNCGRVRRFLCLAVPPGREDRGDSMAGCSLDIVASVADHCRVGDVDAEGSQAQQQFGDDLRFGGPSLAVRCPADVDEVAFHAKAPRESYCLVFHFGGGHGHGNTGRIKLLEQFDDSFVKAGLLSTAIRIRFAVVLEGSLGGWFIQSRGCSEGLDHRRPDKPAQRILCRDRRADSRQGVGST